LEPRAKEEIAKMPSYVIVQSGFDRIGETKATLCDPGVLGFPDRRTDVPVKATITEKSITIDDEPRARAIISSMGENGVTTFLVDGSTRGLRNRERRAALARALWLLQQLTSTLMPFTAESEEPGLVAETLQLP
jgi:hypothetical protein